MLVYKVGDVLQAEENIICHQVNVDGVMGGGLALQIASAYPKVEELYEKICEEKHNDYGNLKGDCLITPINENQIIANCFTQKTNFDTDYEALEKCFKNLLHICKDENLSICAPYMMGCGIANGDWNIVSEIFQKLSDKYGVDIVIYKLGDKQ